jgi:hypothetical protein
MWHQPIQHLSEIAEGDRHLQDNVVLSPIGPIGPTLVFFAEH